MAVTEQRQLFAPQIESLAEQYAKSMGTMAAQPFTGADITAMAPQVAGQQALQQKATALTGAAISDPTTGLASYAPYVSQAGTQLGLAGTGLAGAETGLAGLGAQYAAPAVTGLQGAQATLAGAPGVSGVQDYIGAAGTGLGQAGTAMAGVSPYVTGAGGLTLSLIHISEPTRPY